MEKNSPNIIKYSFKAFRKVLSVDTKIGFPYLLSKSLNTLLNLYFVYLSGKFLDSIGYAITNHDTFTFSIFAESKIAEYAFLIIITKLFLIISTKIIEYADLSLYNLFWTETYENMMKKVSSLNLEDIESNRIQQLITTVRLYSIDSVWNTFVQTNELINNIIVLIGTGYIIITQMSLWAIIVVLFVIPEAFYRYKQDRKLKDFRDQNATRLQHLDYIYQQSMILNNFPELRVDNIFKFFIDSYDNSSNIYDKAQNNIRLDAAKISSVWAFIDNFLLKIVQILLIPIAIVEKYTIGKFKYLFDYLESLYNASWNVVWKSFLIKGYSFYVKDYFDLIEYKGFGDITNGSQKLDPLKVPSIEFINVDFSYPESAENALNNVSFKIEPGEKVAFVGKDNSGKSTIAKLLCGLYRIGPGDILIDNISIRNLQRGELKDKISVVFENYIKYDFSLRKNITISESEREFSRRKFEESLEMTELSTWVRENNIDEAQILGKQISAGIQISSGHWQRIAIARALYRDRHILILDESLTQIDGRSREQIIRNISEYRPKQTLIYITQDEQNLPLFDKVIYIEKGAVKKIDIK